MNDKSSRILALSLILLAGAALRAQTADSPPSATTPAPAPYPYNGTPNTPPPVGLRADVSFPYAFRFHNTGVVADLGGAWSNNFLGGEISYYNAQPHGYDWYNPAGVYGGRIHYDDHLTTLNLAYRYYIPIPLAAVISYQTPLEFYVGGAAGMAWADFYTGDNYPGFTGGPGYNDSSRGRFDANAVAGFQWNFTRSVGLKVGYRYLWVNSAHVFYDNTRLDTGAVEAGLGFRF